MLQKYINKKYHIFKIKYLIYKKRPKKNKKITI